jgi:hypothetical protein
VNDITLQDPLWVNSIYYLTGSSMGEQYYLTGSSMGEQYYNIQSNLYIKGIQGT